MNFSCSCLHYIAMQGSHIEINLSENVDSIGFNSVSSSCFIKMIFDYRVKRKDYLRILALNEL